MNRLTQLPTLRINPAKHLPLTYNERRYYGVFGDTLATALYSNSVRIFSRSLRYYRVSARESDRHLSRAIYICLCKKPCDRDRLH